MRRTFDFIFYILLWLQQRQIISPALRLKWEQDILEGNNMKKMHQTYGFQEHKYKEKIQFPFLYVIVVVMDMGYVSKIGVQEQDKDNIAVMFL